MTTLAILVTGEPSAAIALRAGSYADMVRQTVGRQVGVTMKEFDVRRGELPTLQDVDGLVITGSSHSVCERLPWMLELEAFIRVAVARGCHTLGLCFGHQIIASALGGTVVRNPLGRETGQVIAVPTGTDDALGLPHHPFPVLMVHGDTVQRVPPGSAPLAYTDRDANAAVRFSARCWGTQFHPEFTAEVLRMFIEEERDELLAQGDDPDALRATLESTPESAELVRTFIRQFAGPRAAR